MRVLLVSILLLIAAGQSRSAAQASPPEPAAVVATIRPGSFIRVTLPNGQRITGRYTFAGLGRLGIQQLDHRTDSLRFDAIRGLAVRGRHTKTGAIVGGIAGAGFGIFVGLVSNALCEGGDDCNGASPYLIAIPVFGAGGSLLGAVVGSAFPNWKRVLR